MKTFDLATQYLKEIDFQEFLDKDKNFPLANTEKLAKELDKSFKDFEKDKNNLRSGQPYSKICFNVAQAHFLKKLLEPNKKSLFEFACEIIESKKEILDNPQVEHSENGFPKEIWEQWKKCYDEIKPVRDKTNEEDLFSFFFIAYYYTIYPDRA